MSQENQEQEINITTKHDFYFETPLYERIPVGHLEDNLFSGDVDAYSNLLQDNTTYHIDFDWFDKWSEWENSKHKPIGYAEVTLTCKRKSNDVLRFLVYRNTTNAGFVEKVGQDPSMADLQFSHLQRKYENVLDEKYLKEFKRAIGLASHGVGVGSFVYLRRIFEKLIFQTFKDKQGEISEDIGEFKVKKMEDKIDVLKSFLPSQLVKMKGVYGILSKGIHELDDEVCLTYFNPLKLSIELILDQKIEEKKKMDKDKLVDQQIQKIQQELK